MNTKHEIRDGGCYCGAVRYRVTGPLRDVVHCHCRECQRLNGNFGSHCKAPTDCLEITRDLGLSWFQISATARRGFCNRCGSSLFWQSQQQPATGIIAASLDDHSRLKSLGHIFVDEKAAFYDINDGLPQFPQSSDGEFAGDEV